LLYRRSQHERRLRLRAWRVFELDVLLVQIFDHLRDAAEEEEEAVQTAYEDFLFG
jgi:succinate dehydrogenase flavin-adding protein (antitoxin of CptAB toxin-antitoxin module)